MKTKLIFHQNFVKVHYQLDNERLRVSTGVRISDSSLLCGDNLSIKVENSKKNQIVIDSIRMKIEGLVLTYYHQNSHYPTASILKKLYYKKHVKSKEPVSRKLSLLECFERFLEVKKSDFSLGGKNPKSIKDYVNLYHYLSDFQIHNKRTIKFSDINKNWLNKFVQFLQDSRKDSEGKKYWSRGNLCLKTIKKRIVFLLSFFRWLDSEGLFPFPKTISNYNKLLNTSETVKSVLSKKEVRLLYEFDFSDEKLRYVRDVFIFSCQTGLRWSDLISISKSNIKYVDNIGYVVEKTTIKTNKKVVIYLNRIALSILISLNYSMSKYSNPNFNKYLKKLLRESNLFESDTEFRDDKGIVKKRWQCISIHRARDTFITTLLQSNVPLPEVMKLTGHSNVSGLNPYIDLKSEVTTYTDTLLSI